MRRAKALIRPIENVVGPSGISVKAVNADTGATFTYGADGGMLTGSIVKLLILEALLLRHQQRDTQMTSYEEEAAEEMIENSDNDAGERLFNVDGRADGLDNAASQLGLKNTHANDHYGLTRTCAADFVRLVRNANAPGPLTAASRDYILDLQANIESDQRWGVSAAADKGTVTHLKNGWLDVDDDGGKWLVNSVGSLTVHGHAVYLAVLTQHNPDFHGGIRRVEQLATIAAAVVAPK